MKRTSTCDPAERMMDLSGLRVLVNEIHLELKRLGQREAARHLAIVDIALRRAIIDLEADMTRAAGARNHTHGSVANRNAVRASLFDSIPGERRHSNDA